MRLLVLALPHTLNRRFTGDQAANRSPVEMSPGKPATERPGMTMPSQRPDMKEPVEFGICAECFVHVFAARERESTQRLIRAVRRGITWC